MNFWEIHAFALLSIIGFVYHSNAISIDDKLDFGGRKKSHTSFVNDGTIHRSSFSPVHHSSTVTNVESDDDFDKIGVVCVDGGCNTTKSNDQSADTIKTDVHVHIETKIDLNQNKTKQVDDTPDVPIIVGTDSSNSRNYDGIRTDPESIFTPSNEPRYYQSPESNIYSYGRMYSSSVSSYPFELGRKLDSTSYQNKLNANPEVSINGNSFLPVAMDVARDLLTNNYRTNGFEMSVPYFDPSLHNHHFGETPPPQNVYYPKHVGVMNPVEFKVIRPNWKPSQWQNQFDNHRHGVLPMSMEKEVKCFCENADGRTALQWYPSQTRRGSSVSNSNRRVSINDPGSQINDKLAPLN